MRAMLVIVGLFFVSISAFPQASFAFSKKEEKEFVKQKLKKAILSLRTMDNLIRDRISDQKFYKTLMPRDNDLDPSFYDKNIEMNQEYLDRLTLRRIQLAKTINAVARHYHITKAQIYRLPASNKTAQRSSLD